jgi:PAS domain S-box-containing protein
MEKNDVFVIFRSIIDVLPDALIVTDNKGIIQLVNNNTCSVFGYSSHEIVGKEIEVLMPERNRNNHRKHVKNYFDNPERRRMAPHRKVMGLKKNGNEFEVDITLSPLLIDKNMYSISLCRDITDKRTDEHYLLNQKKRLELINKDLERFSYTISHDLKAPIAKIEGLLEVLFEDLRRGKQEDAKDISIYIKESLSSMGNLIKEVLEGAKKGQMKEDEKTDMKEMISELYKLITIPEDISLEINCIHQFIPGKKIQILQVFLNLISNGIKFNNKEKGLIRIDCQDSGSFYQFIYTDNGPGIPLENIDRIFGLFEKGNSPDKQLSSHGIGLYTIKTIVESRGGEIHVKSKPNEGVEFKIDWPKMVKQIT